MSKDTLLSPLGDRHDGKQTCLVTDGEQTYIYKPRNADTERAWEAFLCALRSAGFSLLPGRVEILSEDETGHRERPVPHTPIAPETLPGYFRRCGALLFFAWLFGSTDLHAENLIASGGVPVPVDLETLFSGVEARASETGMQSLAWSVYRAHLLPQFDGKTDISGFSGTNADAKNLPLVGEETPFVPDYADAICEGFTAAFRFAHEHQALLADGIQGFSRCRFRVILRPTDVYGKMTKLLALLPEDQRPLYALALIRPAYERDIDPERAQKAAGVIRAEADAIARGDVPLFAVYGDGLDLYARNDMVLPGYLRTSPVDFALERLNGLSEAELQRQTALIRLSYDALRPQRADDIRPYGDASDFGYDQRSRRADDIRPDVALKTNDLLVGSGLAPTAQQAQTISNRFGRIPNIPMLLSSKSTTTGGGKPPPYTPSNHKVYHAKRCNKGASDLGSALRSKRADDIRPYTDTSELGSALRGLDACVVPGHPTSFVHLASDSVGKGYFESAGWGLYDGLSGILCAYAAVFHKTRDADVLARLHALYAPMPEALSGEKLALTDRACSLGDGFGGMIAALLHLAGLTGEAHFRDDAFTLAARLDAGRSTIESTDVLNGAGGLCLQLPKLPAALARPLAEALLPLFLETKPTLTGAAHGAAGQALCLAALQKVLPERDLRAPILALLRWENEQFDAEQGNWSDLRRGNKAHFMGGWCSGAPGVGLTRQRLLEYVNDPEIIELCKRDIARSVQWLERMPFAYRDTLCCGNAARLIAAVRLGAETNGLRARISGSMTPESPRLYHMLGTADKNPGLMQGVSGVIYARAMDGDAMIGEMLL